MRRLCVISESGLVWSMNCESWLEPKNSLIAAETGLALIRSCGIRFSLSACESRSRTARSTRTRPERNWFSASSPTAAHAAVAEVVDVVDLAAAVAQLDQDLDHRDDVVLGERHRARELVAPHAAVELHAAHVRQVVAVLAEEETVEERLHGVFRRRLAGAHHAVDRHLGVQRVGGLVHAQRLRDVRALVEVVGVDRLHFLDAGIAGSSSAPPR